MMAVRFSPDNTMNASELITQHIVAALPTAQVEVESPDNVHFTATVKATEFVGLSLVKHHRLVMDAVQPLMQDVHALSVTTLPIEES